MLILLVVLSVTTTSIGWEIENFNVEKCLNKVVNEHLPGKTSAVFDSNDDLRMEYPKIQFNDVNTLNEVEMKMNNYILGYGSLEQLNETLFNIKSRFETWNSRGKYLIIAQNINGKEVEEILKVLWRFNVYKTLVAACSNNQALFYDYDFVKSGCGKTIKAEVVGTCKEGALNVSVALYRPKIYNNLCNNTLNVLWVPAKPFVIDYRLEKNPGMYVTLIKLFGERNNLSVQFVGDSSRYTPEVDNTAEELIIAKDLDNNYGDVFISLVAIDYRKCVRAYDCTKVAHHEHVYWILPKPNKNPFWRSIASPFTFLMWTAVCVVILSTTTMCWLMGFHGEERRAFRSLSRCAILSLRVVLNVTDNLNPNTHSFRIFFMLFSASAFILNILYQGKLFLFLSNPGHEKAISTLGDILDSGLPLRFQPGYGLLFLFFGEKNLEVFERFVAQNNTSSDDEIKEAVAKRSYITISTGGQIAVNPHLKGSFNTLEVYFFHNTLLVKRDHVLLGRLDALMERAYENGFYLKWISDIQVEYFKRPPLETSGVFKLTTQHLQGAFIVLAIGNLAAFIVFVLEIGFNKVSSRLH